VLARARREIDTREDVWTRVERVRFPKGAGVAKRRSSTVGDIEDVHVRDLGWAPETAAIRSSTMGLEPDGNRREAATS